MTQFGFIYRRQVYIYVPKDDSVIFHIYISVPKDDFASVIFRVS